MNRREFVAGLGMAGLGAFLPDRVLRGQTPAVPSGNPRRLDLHHHFGSPRWIRRAAEIRRQGWEAFQDYSPAKTVEAMDKAGVATAFVSCTEPGIWFGDDFRIERHAAIELARDMNDYGARMMSDYKGRFGLFAVLPLPDIDASLKEIEYAFDTLRADGVGLLTSYGDIWLGDERLRPVFDELNRRNAVVYTHPTDATCCHSLAGANPLTLEWFTDTARSILSLMQDPPNARGGGAPAPSAATRYSNITFIWSHGGGALLGATRVVGTVSASALAGTAPVNSRLHHVRRFYYDTAGAANPIVMQGMKTLLGGTSHIVFGTDHPYGGGNLMNNVTALQTVGFTPEELRGIDRENALRFLPTYRAS
ncbi:MAG: amidohydrolase family protein [Acidobacteria bacterium]|nr:amidohydrolase family protein [Acidobacteriota bacterium]